RMELKTQIQALLLYILVAHSLAKVCLVKEEKNKENVFMLEKGGDCQECQQFFYKNVWPKFSRNSIKWHFICQYYENQPSFFTLYDIRYRMPLFSAYRLNLGAKEASCNIDEPCPEAAGNNGLVSSSSGAGASGTSNTNQKVGEKRPQTSNSGKPTPNVKRPKIESPSSNQGSKEQKPGLRSEENTKVSFSGLQEKSLSLVDHSNRNNKGDSYPFKRTKEKTSKENYEEENEDRKKLRKEEDKRTKPDAEPFDDMDRRSRIGATGPALSARIGVAGPALSAQDDHESLRLEENFVKKTKLKRRYEGDIDVDRVSFDDDFDRKRRSENDDIESTVANAGEVNVLPGKPRSEKEVSQLANSIKSRITEASSEESLTKFGPGLLANLPEKPKSEKINSTVANTGANVLSDGESVKRKRKLSNNFESVSQLHTVAGYRRSFNGKNFTVSSLYDNFIQDFYENHSGEKKENSFRSKKKSTKGIKKSHKNFVEKDLQLGKPHTEKKVSQLVNHVKSRVTGASREDFLTKLRPGLLESGKEKDNVTQNSNGTTTALKLPLAKYIDLTILGDSSNDSSSKNIDQEKDVLSLWQPNKPKTGNSVSPLGKYIDSTIMGESNSTDYRAQKRGPGQGGASDTTKSEKKKQWKNEPQLELSNVDPNRGKFENMMKTGSKNFPVSSQSVNNQPQNSNFENSGWDRGHLNPNRFQIDDDSEATYTLTNAVPQYPGFNSGYWCELEQYTLQAMKTFCKGGVPYLITGATPGLTPKEREMDIGTKLKEKQIVIPLMLYTAACCDKGKESFSFGFYGTNEAKPKIGVIKVNELISIVNKQQDPTDRIILDQFFPGDADNCKSDQGSPAMNEIKTKVEEMQIKRLENLIFDESLLKPEPNSKDAGSLGSGGSQASTSGKGATTSAKGGSNKRKLHDNDIKETDEDVVNLDVFQ
uniref:Uncharacterized protein n=2 Tax=Clytia hemisphaerica TaxID=252671 RepID=A0A7M5XCS7_9CNID